MIDRLIGHYTPDDLLTELRAREGGLTTTCHSSDDCPTSGPLRDVPSQALYEALIVLQITVYGTDDREDVYSPQLLMEAPLARASTSIPFEALRAADSVAALFRKGRVRDNADGTITLETRPLGVQRGLCPAEPFADQPAGAFGTGFLITPTVLATAGHCVDHCAESEMRVVFGFRMLSPFSARLTVDVREVFGVSRTLAKVHDPKGADWALLELDRPAVGRTPLPVRRSGRVADDATLYTLGHPCGLPLKFAGNARVRDNAPESYFVANLDTYAGSSGSPVFGPDHVVEGLIARGERDFVRVGNCYRSLIVPDSGGRGQDCIRITPLSGLISS